MVSKINLFALWIAILILPKHAISQDLKVAVASSLIGVIEELVAEVQSDIEAKIEIVPGASGTLTHQIVNGAPYDILIAADNKYCSILSNQGISTRTHQDVFRGRLVIWSNQLLDKSSLVPSIRTRLVESKRTTLAIANPKTAPYGTAAKSWLEQQGLMKDISNLIIGNNVSLVNQYIFTKAVDIVITSHSSSFAQIESSGYWYPIDDDHSNTVEHCISIISSDSHAIRLKNLIFSTERQNIWTKHGYTINEPESTIR